MEQQNAPVTEGQEVNVIVDAVGEKGDGIVKVKGFVLFVPGVSKGDSIKIRVTKVLKNVGFAEKIGDADAPVQKPRKEVNLPKKPTKEIEVDEETGKEKIKGDTFEAEYDPSLDSEDF